MASVRTALIAVGALVVPLAILLWRIDPLRMRRRVAMSGAALCLFVMVGLPPETWVRFAVWLIIGLALYIFYGYRHSKLHVTPKAVP